MNIVDDCRVPRPFKTDIARMALIGAVICGVAAVVAAIGAAILGEPVALMAAGAALVTAEALAIGWGVNALILWLFRNRRPTCCI